MKSKLVQYRVFVYDGHVKNGDSVIVTQQIFNNVNLQTILKGVNAEKVSLAVTTYKGL